MPGALLLQLLLHHEVFLDRLLGKLIWKASARSRSAASLWLSLTSAHSETSDEPPVKRPPTTSSRRRYRASLPTASPTAEPRAAWSRLQSPEGDKAPLTPWGQGEKPPHTPQLPRLLCLPLPRDSCHSNREPRCLPERPPYSRLFRFLSCREIKGGSRRQGHRLY